MKHEVDKRLSNCEHKLRSLGPARETDEQQRTFLLDLAAKFQEITSYALDAYYGRSSLFEENPSLRLATRIVDLNSAFSDDVWLKGHTMHFSKSTTWKGNKSVDEPSTEAAQAAEVSPEDDGQVVTQHTSRSISEDQEPEDSKFPELSDVIEGP